MSKPLTADEAWRQVLSNDKLIDVMRGRSVLVTMAKEQHEAIEGDPLRQEMRAMLGEMLGWT